MFLYLEMWVIQMSNEINSEEIEQKILTTAEETFEDASGFDLETDRSEIVGWDSLGNLQLVMALEEDFDILFDEEAVADIRSLQDLSEIVVDELNN